MWASHVTRPVLSVGSLSDLGCTAWLRQQQPTSEILTGPSPAWYVEHTPGRPEPVLWWDGIFFEMYTFPFLPQSYWWNLHFPPAIVVLYS